MSRIAASGAVALLAGSALFGSAGLAAANAEAEGVAAGSPGVLSGNLLQVPVHVPVNVCGNTVSVIGLLNPAFGNACANVSADDDEGHKGSKHDHEHEHMHGK